MSQQEWDGVSKLPKRQPNPEAELYRIERDEARKLAQMMYQALLQFPSSLDELIPDWPQEEPIWLWRTP